jgi:hypothetical protein
MQTSQALKELDAERRCTMVIDHLKQAISLHANIAGEGIALADESNVYQNPWRAALSSLVAGSGDDFEMLRMLRGL